MFSRRTLVRSQLWCWTIIPVGQSFRKGLHHSRKKPVQRKISANSATTTETLDGQPMVIAPAMPDSAL